jgi:hypothetical protein
MVIKSMKLSALALAATTFFAVLPVSQAEAQYHRRHAGDALVGGLVGGAIGGLAAGAIISANRPVYPAPVYVAPPVAVEPSYVEETGPVYRKRPVYWARPSIERAHDIEVVPSCYMQRQRIWLDRYTYTHRYTRICD